MIKSISEIGHCLNRHYDSHTLDQLKAQDPRSYMSLLWYHTAMTEISIDQLCESYKDIDTAVENFWHTIGRKIDPLSYEGSKLKEVLKKHNKSSDWVDRCIEFYKDNWRFN